MRRLFHFHHRYYSAFLDTDSAFGSLGSFFDADITEGSYEANPPFVCDAPKWIWNALSV